MHKSSTLQQINRYINASEIFVYFALPI